VQLACTPIVHAALVAMPPVPSGPSDVADLDSGPLGAALASATANRSESCLRAVIAGPDPTPGPDEDVARLQETAVLALADLLVSDGRAGEIAPLAATLRPFFATIPKARTAKIVRGLLDAVAKADGEDAAALQISLCHDTIAWCNEEKRTFLRQRVEGRLASLYLANARFSDALSVINNLLKEVKRLDDKAHLLEVQLVESRIHHALRNLPKARAALTSARTTANAIYVPLILQAEIDMQAGIIAAEEKDYKTAYSYFYEGFEGFMSLEDVRAVSNLKYMLLTKIMTGNAEDVPSIVHGSVALKYAGRQVDAMKSVASAHAARSLELFESTLVEYKAELSDDPIVHAHLNSLYDTLKEHNLARIIEPFSRVEISHVAHLINLPLDDVEHKLSQMILDKKLNGILDQGAGCLIVFDDAPLSTTYQASLDTLISIDNVVDSLFTAAAAMS
jgi:26S proteasome regulatory subunit N6